jgi:hypothetical protein
MHDRDRAPQVRAPRKGLAEVEEKELVVQKERVEGDAGLCKRQRPRGAGGGSASFEEWKGQTQAEKAVFDEAGRLDDAESTSQSNDSTGLVGRQRWDEASVLGCRDPHCVTEPDTAFRTGDYRSRTVRSY